MKNKIKIHRSIKGVSQQELADKMAVSRQTLNAIENGKYHPTLLLGMRMSEFFDCKIEELFELEEIDRVTN
ncbi:MAG: helix-turn-helix transcriptional regulator [Flavobacteriales bacterium]